MAKKKTKDKATSNTIAKNNKARFEYQVEDTLEAGLQLQGWEIKSLRAGKVNISECYITVKNGEAFMFGSTITPLDAACSHIVADPTRTRKLLLNRRELDVLASKVDRQGYAIIALALYWKQSWIKIKIGLGKGKKEHDKRSDAKDREWQIEKARTMKHKVR